MLRGKQVVEKLDEYMKAANRLEQAHFVSDGHWMKEARDKARRELIEALDGMDD